MELQNEDRKPASRVAVIAGNHKGPDVDRVIAALRKEGIEVVTADEATHLLEGQELDRVIARMNSEDVRRASAKLGELGVDRNNRRKFGVGKAQKKAKFRELQARAFKGD